MAIGQAFQNVPEIGERLDVVELGGGDKRTHRCPSSGSAIGSSEQVVLAAEGDRSDCALDVSAPLAPASQVR
jgi:hypothetical protein